MCMYLVVDEAIVLCELPPKRVPVDLESTSRLEPVLGTPSARKHSAPSTDSEDIRDSKSRCLPPESGEKRVRSIGSSESGNESPHKLIVETLLDM